MNNNLLEKILDINKFIKKMKYCQKTKFILYFFINVYNHLIYITILNIDKDIVKRYCKE